MKTLEKNISSIGFYCREKIGGRLVKNKCGRDFLYYALNHYFPDRFNPTTGSPKDIDDNRLFGTPVPAYLAWTQVQFAKVPNMLASLGLELRINSRSINSFAGFVRAIIFSRMTADSAIERVQSCVDRNEASAIDISLGAFGLVDHVLFVYGYDEDNLYVIDTHKVPHLEYTEVTNNSLLFRLPKETVRKRWSPFGRTWEVIKRA